MDQRDLMVRCPLCGTKNRIPRGKQQDNPKCGKCHNPLFSGTVHNKPVDVTDVTFDDEVVHHTGTVLVDFWAAWCGPCRMMGPILEQIAKEYAGKLKVAKLNVDENPITASLYAIQSIPALLIFKNGKHLETLVGAMSKPELERRLSALVS